MIQFKGNIFLKWTKIALICGADSFFYGLIGGASVPAMLLGIFTFILVYSFAEMYPATQARMQRDSAFSQAVKNTIKIRLLYCLMVIIGLIISSVIGSIFYGTKTWILNTIMYLFMAPEALNLRIGHIATLIQSKITGINFSHPDTLSYLQNFTATYLSTCITILIHSILFFILFIIVYFWLKRKAIKT